VERGSWPVLPVFEAIGREGRVPAEDMYRTFNMGIGVVVIAAPAEAERIEAHLAGAGEKSWRIGEIIQGARAVAWA
jgi:phosphoribosylformylglycinamidine cyclo-ligase